MLEGKRVLLIEDTIVRSTTMKSLLHDMRERGGAREIHVRVACPPIVAPCFYGIDMSTVRELFAPRFMNGADRREEDLLPWRGAGGRQSLLSAAGGRGPLHRLRCLTAVPRLPDRQVPDARRGAALSAGDPQYPRRRQWPDL